MAEIDPIAERREREEQERKNKSLKNIMYALAGVAVLLAGGLAYIWSSKSSLVKDLNLEKQDLTEQIEALKSDYDSLTSDYESINSQLDSSREEVNQLVERIKQTEATDRAQIRRYEKELGTLRSIMKGYIVQIDSLNTLNHKLTVEAANARKEAAEAGRLNEELTAQVAGYKEQVAVGSKLKARGITLVGINGSGSATDRSSRVVKLRTDLSLVENAIAKTGARRIYIRVKGPDGILMTGTDQKMFTSGGEQMVCSASREVDYQGSEVEMSIYFAGDGAFTKGTYSVDVYSADGKLGSADLILR